MPKKSSSKLWKQRQASDPYVLRAQAEGWRSRAIFKLMQIHEREALIRPGSLVVDLGAAPGGWSQYAATIVNDSGGRSVGRVIALDRLEMAPLAGVECICADFTEDKALEMLRSMLDSAQPNLVMSDMAPNISGTRSVDQPKAMYLAELARDFACEFLAPGGSFVVKLFHGEGFDHYVRAIRRQFAAVKVRKPEASRAKSRETYLVARNYRL